MKMQAAASVAALSLLLACQLNANASPAPIGSALTDDSATPSALQQGARIIQEDGNDDGFIVLGQNEQPPSRISPEAQAMKNAVKSAQEAEAAKAGVKSGTPHTPTENEIQQSNDMLQLKNTPEESNGNVQAEESKPTNDMLKKSNKPHGAPVNDDNSISASDLPEAEKARKPGTPVEAAEETAPSDDLSQNDSDESQPLQDTSPHAKKPGDNNSDEEMPIIPKKDHSAKPVKIPEASLKNVAPVVNANDSNVNAAQSRVKAEIVQEPAKPAKEVQLTKNLVDQIPVTHFQAKQHHAALKHSRRPTHHRPKHRSKHHNPHKVAHSKATGVKVIPHNATHKGHIKNLILTKHHA